MPVKVEIPKRVKDCIVTVDGHEVRLTNLDKIFFPEQSITKRELLQYYADVSAVLIPHLSGRAMVMKRYPNGIDGDFFFMKRSPSGKPDWVEVCTIEHRSGNIIDFPVVNDTASLLWLVNLGCIDLNQWYAKCDDVHRPDYLHFDLDPVPGAEIKQVLEAALHVREALSKLKMPSYPKTTGSKGIHVYVPIVRAPLQKEVWTFAKRFAKSLEKSFPALITAEYRVAHRPADHVLVDYNQNAWGRTLASVYSVRPKPQASVSTPVTWDEIEGGLHIEDFRMDNVPARILEIGDLFSPLLQPRGRVKLESVA